MAEPFQRYKCLNCGTIYDEAGGESYSLKYTGYLTDNFTLSALYGNGESKRSNYGITAGGICCGDAQRQFQFFKPRIAKCTLQAISNQSVFTQ